MIKIETHAHTGGSWCALCELKEIFRHYKSYGYGGIVVTNHYSYAEYKSHECKSFRDYAKYFLSLIDSAIDMGKKHNMKVFYGAEVRLNSDKTEYMLYGFDKNFLLDNANLWEFTQGELFKIANLNGLFMYQTHPFRQGVTVGDARFMHGAESFNGHFHHVNNNVPAKEFCKQNNLIEMSGTDFHDPGQPVTAGIYIPEDINDNKGLVKYIMSKKAKLANERDMYIDWLIKYKASEGVILDRENLKE
ncbi:MAG: hypothetical protein E7372_02525 [Clostridiales bacterium]|nr:hypothetical protein [Clostridiales bacterium]